MMIIWWLLLIIIIVTAVIVKNWAIASYIQGSQVSVLSLYSLSIDLINIVEHDRLLFWNVACPGLPAGVYCKWNELCLSLGCV